MMETDYLTALPTADLGSDRQILGTSVEPLNTYLPIGKMQYDTTVLMFDQFCGESLLAECMPQLADVLSAGYMQYDSTVPANLFSDGENSSDEDLLPLVTSSISTTSSSGSSLTSEPGLLTTDTLEHNTFDITSFALPKSTLGLENIHVPTTSAGQLDPIGVDALFNLGDDFQITDNDFGCLDLHDAAALFENGIAAQDMSSLLEQFEEAAANLPELEEEIQTPSQKKEEAKIILKIEPETLVPDVQTTPPPSDSEVMRLLMAKTPAHSVSAESESPLPKQDRATRSSKSSKQPTAPSRPVPRITKPVASKPISMHQRPPSGTSLSSLIPPKSTSGTSKSKSSSSKSSSALSSKSSSTSRKDRTSSKSTASTSSSTSQSKRMPTKPVSVLSKSNTKSVKGAKSKANTPPPEVIEKIRTSNKRKSTIMLPSVVPSKSQRGHAVELSNSSRQKSTRKTKDPVVPSVQSLFQKELRVKTNKLAKSSASAPCSPSNRAKPIATYSAPGSPVLTAPGVPKRPTVRTSHSETNVVKEEVIKVSSNYFDLIVDHDYCQNSRSVPRQSSFSSSSATSSTSPLSKMGTSDSLETSDEQDGSVLKSLLLNKNLADELRRQAAEQRACMKRKASVNLDVIDMEIEEPETRFSKFSRERTDLVDQGTVAGIALGTPLPPLPPLDQLPKDHEIRALEEKGSDSNESLRPANDMNLILNKAKHLLKTRHQKKDSDNKDIEEKSCDSNESLNSAADMNDFLNKARRIMKFKHKPKSSDNSVLEEKGSDSNESLNSAADMKSFLNQGKRDVKHKKEQRASQTGAVVEKCSDSNESVKSASAMDSVVKSHKAKWTMKGRNHPQPQKPQENLFDKLPGYFTALSKPAKQDKVKMENARNMYNTIPAHDRDPSPERDSGYNKLPTYYCFTNSIKYDDSKNPPMARAPSPIPETRAASPPHTDAPVEEEGECKASVEDVSSRSQTPNLLIVSRANSESRSRPPSRVSSPARSRSRSNSGGRSSSSSSCSSSCKSRSASSERSPSPVVKSLQERGRSARKRTFRRKRHSYSSSQSSSCSRSRSRSRSRLRSPRQQSSSRSRSRSCSKYGSRSRQASRSRSPSRSPSRLRDMMKRGERVRNSFTSKREEDRVLEEQDKKKQIEERRIVYVGCIPSNFTRRDLRRQFDRFGEVEDVSVHFREHGGDNYGFVTYVYTCDAFAAIEKGKTIPSMSRYDLCFGGRREFCKTEYADLDGDMEEDEEMSPLMGRSSGPLDFDELLRQAQTKIKKKPLAKKRQDTDRYH